MLNRNAVSMSKSPLFYKYYDTLFQKKDYKKETELVINLHKKFSTKPLKNILEIGCGTGNHTKELAKNNFEVIAIDTDQEMVKIASEKLVKYQNVQVLETKVEDLLEKDFDLCVALFNVVTYIGDVDSLKSFLNAISSRLNPGGIFIFDMWNGEAVLKDPPKEKVTEVLERDRKVVCRLVPLVEAKKNKTRLIYNFEVFEGEIRVEKGKYSFEQTLWRPQEVEELLGETGLTIKLNTPTMDLSRKATERDWKVMYCCQKS